MNFSNKTKNRLAVYKSIYFPLLHDGIWKNNNKSYPHILPEENKFENLLPAYRDRIITYLNNNQIKLHTDFHHLNSSQAMCFNFFFPFYFEQSIEIITDFFGLKNERVNYDTVCFEKEGLEAEFGRKPTSFDFYFETNSGKQIHFEIKYTEDGFGKSVINSEKFKNLYSKFLQPLNPTFHSTEKFFESYQILRNLIHINDNSFVIFVYPLNNNSIFSIANRVKKDFLVSNYHDHFFHATWEKLFDDVSTTITNPNIKNQLIDFKEKYLSLE